MFIKKTSVNATLHVTLRNIKKIAYGYLWEEVVTVIIKVKSIKMLLSQIWKYSIQSLYCNVYIQSTGECNHTIQVLSAITFYFRTIDI